MKKCEITRAFTLFIISASVLTCCSGALSGSNGGGRCAVSPSVGFTRTHMKYARGRTKTLHFLHLKKNGPHFFRPRAWDKKMRAAREKMRPPFFSAEAAFFAKQVVLVRRGSGGPTLLRCRECSVFVLPRALFVRERVRVGTDGKPSGTAAVGGAVAGAGRTAGHRGRATPAVLRRGGRGPCRR